MTTTTTDMTNGETGKVPPAASAQPPAIDPNAVSVNVDGLVYREFFVRAPEGLVSDDLRTPEIWRKVQASRRTSLRKFDALLCVAYDETWFIEARVVEADPQRAVLSFQAVRSMPGPATDLPADDNHFSRWNGALYDLVRRRDQHVVARAANVPLLWKELQNQYPRPV